MNAEEFEAFNERLRNEVPKCPACQKLTGWYKSSHTRYPLTEDVDSDLEPGKLPKELDMIPVFRKNCGFTAFFSPIAMGIEKNERQGGLPG